MRAPHVRRPRPPRRRDRRRRHGRPSRGLRCTTRSPAWASRSRGRRCASGSGTGSCPPARRCSTSRSTRGRPPRTRWTAAAHGNPFGQMFGTALALDSPRPRRTCASSTTRTGSKASSTDGRPRPTTARSKAGFASTAPRSCRSSRTPVPASCATAARAALDPDARRPRRGPCSGSRSDTIRPRVDSARGRDRGAARAARCSRGNIVLVTGRGNVVVKPRQLATALGTHIRGHAPRRDGRRATGCTPRSAPRWPGSNRRRSTLPSPSPKRTRCASFRRRTGARSTWPRSRARSCAASGRIVAPLRSVKPQHDTKWAEALGIVRQVGGFTTDYPAGETRVTNIHRGADLLNNTIVEPGQIFSLNRTVGPRTAARGFVTAPVFARGRVLRRLRRRRQPARDDHVQRGVLRRLRGHHAPAAHDLHLALPTGSGGDRQLRRDRSPVPQRHAARDPDPHVLQRDLDHGERSTATTTAGPCARRTARRRIRSRSPTSCSSARRRRPSTRTTCARRCPPGETAQISNGDAGFDVAFDRVIDQPGKPERREHYTWHYTMLPNQILVGGNSGPNPVSTPADGRSEPAVGRAGAYPLLRGGDRPPKNAPDQVKRRSLTAS